MTDAALRERVEAIHQATKGIYGAPRICAELADDHAIFVSRERVARLMREAQIRGVAAKRGPRSQSCGPEGPAAPGLVRRNFTATAPNQLWVADITYVPTWEGWLFSAVVIDAFSRRCVGWSMRNDLKAELVIDALGMAVTRRAPEGEVVHHSDRGSQYASLAFGTTLAESGIAASMGSRGDAYDNAAAESFMATIKKELIHRQTFRSRNAARLAIFDYIECFYNPIRLHSTLGQKSPVNYELAAAAAGS